MRVLLIEDDSATAQSIELMLKSESFNVYTTDLGEEGVDLGKLYDYDIILLDLNLPDMSGYEVLRTLRLSKVKTPILILSGMAGIEDKVRGLGFGADDYMTKPFHKDELVARIHAIVRRSKGHAQSVITTGDLIVNLDAKTVEVGGQRVHLTGKEYQMLELLSLRKGTTLTKEMFLNHLYGGMDEPELIVVDTTLPDMAAADFIREVLSYEAETKPRVVICIAEIDVGAIMRAKRAGASGYLLKPFNRPQLLERFREFEMAA
jgi:two-component system cell cycle response regulator CtrA